MWVVVAGREMLMFKFKKLSRILIDTLVNRNNRLYSGTTKIQWAVLVLNFVRINRLIDLGSFFVRYAGKKACHLLKARFSVY